MRYFTLTTVPLVIMGILILGATACTPVDNGASETLVPRDCRSHSSSITHDLAANTTSALLAAVARARQLDARCGPPDDRTRICRALFLLATLDPAFYLEDQPLRHEVAAALAWALGDARSVAPQDLVGSLDALQQTTGVLTTAIDDRSLFDALARRADPAITDPVDDHWLANCR